MKQLVVIVGVLAALPCSAAPSFDRDVTPILRVYCSGCHNDRDKEGEFSVETFASLRRGGAEAGDPVLDRRMCRKQFAHTVFRAERVRDHKVRLIGQLRTGR